MTISTRSEMPTIDGSAESVATTLTDTAFVRVICRSNGDAIAAAGLLARALRRESTPFQIRADQFGHANPTVTDQDDGCCIALGLSHPAADININPVERSVTRSVYAVTEALTTPTHASESGVDTTDDVSGEDVNITIPPTDTLLALAGIITTGVSLETKSASNNQEQTQAQSQTTDGSGFATSLLETLTTTDTVSVDQQPGVGIPISNVVDGLAHSTLMHASFSGDVDATHAMMAEIDLDVDIDAHSSEGDDQGEFTDAVSLIDLSDEDQRTIASAVTIDVIKASTPTVGTAISLEQALHPQYLPDGPMTTIEGYADVLRAVSRERPGTAIAFAISHDASDAALSAWREHAQAVHHILQTAHTGRYDGVYLLRCRDHDEFQDSSTTSGPDETSSTTESGRTETDSSVGDISTPGRLLTVAELASRYQTPESLVLAIGEEVVAVATQPTRDTQSTSTTVDAVVVAEALRTNIDIETTDIPAENNAVSQMDSTTTPAESDDVDDGANAGDTGNDEINQMQDGWVGDANQALVRVNSTVPPAEIIAVVRELTREES